MKALLLILAATAGANPVVIETEGSAPGTYYMRIDVAADGGVTYAPIDEVFQLGEPSGGGGPPTPDTPLAAISRAGVREVQDYPTKDRNALTLSIAYSSLAAEIGTTIQMDEGDAPWATLNRISVQMRDLVLGPRSVDWAPWKASVDGALRELEGAGGLDSDAKMKQAYLDIAMGLESADGTLPIFEGIPPEFREFLRELIKQLIEIMIREIIGSL